MATKKNLVDNIVKKINYLSAEDAELAIDTVTEYLSAELANNSRIEIRGFGSLSLRQRKYVGKEEFYQVIYYRMAKIIREKLKNG